MKDMNLFLRSTIYHVIFAIKFDKIQLLQIIVIYDKPL